MLLPHLQATINELENELDKISSSRREILNQLSGFIRNNIQQNKPANLNFICTHNSRRSHMAQLWAQTAAYYYGVNDVLCFSGGTEATAFNPKAVKAMQNAGFQIIKVKDGDNPNYEVRYADNTSSIVVFSKTYDDPFNPKKDFAAIMTCSHADENCPLVLGASARISLTYDDPKEFDGTAQESLKYAERASEIGREILFAFSQIKN